MNSGDTLLHYRGFKYCVPPIVEVCVYWDILFQKELEIRLHVIVWIVCRFIFFYNGFNELNSTLSGRIQEEV